MPDNEPYPDRRAVRMKHYDYSQPGFYLVTICVEKRKCVFGKIDNDVMHMNNAGLIAQSIWESLPERFSMVRLDYFVIMPNHMHGIIKLVATQTTPEEICNNPRIPARFQANAQRETIKKANPTLGQIVRTFKGATTYSVRKAGSPDFEWQNGYYESVVRNDKALDHMRDYIINNPLTWTKDSLRA